MVPVLGADIVMGTARKSIFVNTKPKSHVSLSTCNGPLTNLSILLCIA